LFGAAEPSTTPGRTVAPPTAAAVMGGAAVPAHGAFATGMGGARPAAPEQVIKVEVVLKDEHMREIASGTTKAVIANMHAGAYFGKPAG
jgi:hypothetical protein